MIPTVPSAVIRLSARNAVYAAELITKVIDLFHGGLDLPAPMGGIEGGALPLTLRRIRRSSQSAEAFFPLIYQPVKTDF